ncbi:MAG: hypothetical protein M3N14_01590 [Bacteroidota bacterium]|nr:hypothetical protein [Bacteroidota bacterium]
MKKLSTLLIASLLLCSFSTPHNLNGTWEFAGGIYNGKREGATVNYTLQRKYKGGHYEAFAIEKGSKPEKYEAGNYLIAGDTCIDTETFSSQPSKITNIPLHYFYTLRNDTLTLKGKLPGGMIVEEYWKRIR